MARKKMDCNEDLVKDLMQFSPFGALGQVFVVEAIRKYAEACAVEDPAKFDSAFMRGSSWVGVAKDVKARCDAFYSRDAVLAAV